MERNDQMEHKRDPQQIPAALQGQAPAQQERPMRREQAQSGAESIGQTVRVIDAIERTLSDAYRVPLRKNMCVVDASEMADLIGQLRIVLPKSVTQAQSVLTSSQRIIDEAKMRADKTADDADKIYNDTVTKARKFKDEIEAEAEAFDKETRRRAQEDANAILADANTRAEQIVFAAQQQAQKLVDDFGMEFAAALMSYRDKQHHVTIRPNLTRISCAEFEKYMTEQGFDWEKGAFPGAYRVRGGFVSQHPGFRSGLYSIMGEASMLAAQAVCAKPGQQVLDCCAAPGGKACYLAELMQGTGRVYAWDLHEHRVQLISGAAKRLGLDNVRTRVQDARELVDSQVERMDCVLVDAPCSGLGDYLSKPDIKYNITPEGIAALHETQTSILDAACRYVKHGGTLVYSTCTLFKEENEQTVVAFLKAHPEFSLNGLERMLPEKFAKQTLDGMLTLYPHVSGTDGFFIARMTRSKRS